MTSTDKFIVALDARTQLVKDMQAREAAFRDEKTGRLRALRLARDERFGK